MHKLFRGDARLLSKAVLAIWTATVQGPIERRFVTSE